MVDGDTGLKWLAAAVSLWLAYIGWRQWKTAHEKVVLDLFDRRMAIFELIEPTALRAIEADFPGDDEDPIRKMDWAATRAKFLFKPEISALLFKLKAVYEDMNRIHKSFPPEKADYKHQEYRERMEGKIVEIGQLMNLSEDLFEPYVSMTYKNGVIWILNLFERTAREKPPVKVYWGSAEKEEASSG